MPKSKIRAAIKGAYGRGNLGDDLLMLASLNVLKKIYPPEEIGIVANPAPYLSRLAPGIAILPNHGWGLPNADLLVYGGGTQFFSFRSTMRSATLLRRGGRLLTSPSRAMDFVLRHALPIERAFKRRAALGIGVGPFVPKSFEESYARQLLQSCDFAAVRDRISEQICRQWNIAWVRRGGDLCFLSELWNNALPRARSTPPQKPRIGIIIRDWGHTPVGQDWVKALIAATDLLGQEGLECTFISFDASDSTWSQLPNDRGDRFLAWNPMRDAPDSFMAKLSEFDLFVTARYHGAVLAALLEKPVICVELDPKLRLAAEALYGKEENSAVWAAPFDPACLVQNVRHLIAQRELPSESLAAAVARERGLAEAMVSRFIEYAKST
ncbi:polysaccharide pyruvyl transferase family protein [Candidatus Sumerlaeota bacterium]|nr:polysaccharide pyruvyl transferase family protein [Candidatus Sumerlaeota bacterium]MBI3737381.1 polysaccharide pyruvyl transferase family protein [Candidatus Sumerlaeota bacterium]